MYCYNNFDKYYINKCHSNQSKIINMYTLNSII